MTKFEVFTAGGALRGRHRTLEWPLQPGPWTSIRNSPELKRSREEKKMHCTSATLSRQGVHLVGLVEVLDGRPAPAREQPLPSEEGATVNNFCLKDKG